MTAESKTAVQRDETGRDEESRGRENRSISGENSNVSLPVSANVSPAHAPIRRNDRGQVADSEAAKALGNRTMFGPGNGRAVKHGLYLRSAAEEIAAVLESYVVDEGGLSEVPARRLDLLRVTAKTQRHFDRLSDTLDTLGMFDKRGRLRVSWLQRIEGLANTLVRLNSTLGLTRQAKSVTLADIIDQHEREKRSRDAQGDRGSDDQAEAQG